jgi:addiction module HigA family antidote
MPADVCEVHPEGFLKSVGLTRNQLSLDIRVPARRVTDTFLGKRRITPDTASGLARCFDVSAAVWLGLQMATTLTFSNVRPPRRSAARSKPTRRRSSLVDWTVCQSEERQEYPSDRASPIAAVECISYSILLCPRQPGVSRHPRARWHSRPAHLE